MSKYIPFAVVLVVLGAGTLIEGRISDRWSKDRSERLAKFSANLKKVPTKVGDWVGVDDPQSEDKMKEFKASNCDAFVSRTYTNREGQQVSVYIVSGTSRHVTIHTPDQCYVGAGYEMVHIPQQYTIEDVPGVEPPPEFLTTRFHGTDRQLQVFWTFSDDGTWLGPRNHKPFFAGRPALYKIYLVTVIDHVKIGPLIDENPTIEFARQFFPAVNQALFPPADSTPAAAEAEAGAAS